MCLKNLKLGSLVNNSIIKDNIGIKKKKLNLYIGTILNLNIHFEVQMFT